MIISKNVQDLVSKIKEGKTVCFKTDTIWGLSADCNNIEAIKNLCKIKKRDCTRPFIFLVKKDYPINELVSFLSPQVKKLINKFWCGPLTIIFDANPKLSFLSPYKIKDTIALRMPQDETTQQILSLLDAPLISTSVNIEGEKALNSFNDISKEFKDEDFFILPSKETNPSENISSTIVSVANNKIEFLREGAISKQEILDCLKE